MITSSNIVEFFELYLRPFLEQESRLTKELAADEAEDSERALRAGMDAHMGKPVEVPQLLATMMHWIG